jgi:hypothetical protein
MARGGRSPWPGLTGTCSPAQFFEVVGGVFINLCCVIDAVSHSRYCSHHLQNQNLKAHVVDRMKPNVLRDLPFSLNQPLQLADYQYIRILKNEIKRGLSSMQ